MLQQQQSDYPGRGHLQSAPIMPVPVNSLSFEHLNALKRKDLLQLCKENGIKATGKNSELIEKLLELSLKPTQATQPQTPSKSTQMRETLDALQRTPLHSIVSSARKTGLPASPMRVPFALSPMAASAGKGKVLLTPSAKEPSQAIKEAFSLESAAQDFPALTNKRQHVESSSSNDSDDECNPSKQKYAKVEGSTGSTFDELLRDQRDPVMQSPAMLDDSISRGREQFSASAVAVDVEEDVEMAASNAEMCQSNVEINQNESDHDHIMHDSNDHDHTMHESNDHIMHESNEILSTHTSHSTTTSHDRLPKSFSSASSSSASSSASSNPLLPSGIVKLLEKKRQESGQGKHATAAAAVPQKKKFDLQESLKRPLTYKPHTGPLNKKP